MHAGDVFIYSSLTLLTYTVGVEYSYDWEKNRLYWVLIYLVMVFGLLYQMVVVKTFTCNGRCYSDMCISFVKEDKKDKKRKTHQCSLNLTSWCLSHWNMIIYFCFSLKNSLFLSCFWILIMVKFCKLQCFCYKLTNMDHYFFLTLFFFYTF